LEDDVIDEERIRSAYEAIAAAAPSPERVRARIAARARVDRRRRLLLAGAGALGGAAAAAAVGIPLLNRNSGETGQLTAPSASPSPSPALSGGPAADGVPLRFAPGWLPDGLTEQYREITYDRTTGSRRSWMPAGTFYPEDHTVPPGISLVIGEQIGDDDSSRPVTIGSVQGRLISNDIAVVAWQPSGGPPMFVVASKVPDQANTAVRVARSVARTDAAARITMVALRMPQRFRGITTLSVHPRPGGWMSTLTSMSTDRTRNGVVIASTGAAPAHAFAQTTRPVGMTLWVPDEQDPSANFTHDEAQQLFGSLMVSAPDLTWVGTR
jgi:hypothetical protein